MIFEDVDDRRGIDEEQRPIGKTVEVQRSHSSRSLRMKRRLSFPHMPRPVPAKGRIEACRFAASYAAIGTSAATGLP